MLGQHAFVTLRQRSGVQRSSLAHHCFREPHVDFRLSERAGQNFTEDYDVNPQRITAILSLSGRKFEQCIERSLELGHSG